MHHDGGYVLSEEGNGVEFQSSNSPFGLKRIPKARLEHRGRNYYELEWDDLPRSEKIKDMWAEHGGSYRRERGPIFRVYMPAKIEYSTTDPVSATCAVDTLDYRIDRDGRVTCEGVWL